MFRFRRAFRLDTFLFREAASAWSAHNAPRLGAALAYYAILSLAPSCLLIVALGGYLFGRDAVRGEIYWQARHFVGPELAAAVQNLLKSARPQKSGIVATIFGFVILFVGASGVFAELRDTLNYVWDVPVAGGSGLAGMLRYRFFSLAAVACVGVLALVSLAGSVIVQAAGKHIPLAVPVPPGTFEVLNFGLTILILSVLFAVIYRTFPSARVDWEDVTVGSVVTAVLFAAGKFLVGVYLGRAGVGSAYGAAGSLIVLLVWVYYSAQIFLYGAEFTHVFSQRRMARPPQSVQTDTTGAPLTR